MCKRQESSGTYWAEVALLYWQVALGADEAIGDVPIDRYALEAVVSKPAASNPAPGARAPPPPIPVPENFDAVALAHPAAQWACLFTTSHAPDDLLLFDLS